MVTRQRKATAGGETVAEVPHAGIFWFVGHRLVALTLARTRLMTDCFPYYLLSDSPEGRKKEAEISGNAPSGIKTERDIRRGFVYQRVLHVTLKSIANNPDIKPTISRKEIDAAIARHAETETLYDKP